MKQIIFDTAREAELYAANHIIATINNRPDCVLGLATGATMEGVYAELARRCQAKEVSFRDCVTFNLDEYIGLDPRDRNSYRFFMNQHLFDLIDIKKGNTHVPDGCAADLEKACAEYEMAIKQAGGLDLQLLGIGKSGHLGFNEPGSPLTSRTRPVDLCDKTMRQNGIYFDAAKGEKMPNRAISMGLGTILEARELLFVATGSRKADIVASALQGEVTIDNPASLIHTHANVTVCLDREAAQKLR